MRQIPAIAGLRLLAQHRSGVQQRHLHTLPSLDVVLTPLIKDAKLVPPPLSGIQQFRVMFGVGVRVRVRLVTPPPFCLSTRPVR